jgi:26S proteasome regulatory subunit N7
MPDVRTFLDSFYKCDYKKFFSVFCKICLEFIEFKVNIIDQISNDEYLNPHKKYFIREMRLVVYSQFLESYKTVTLGNMAAAFGVSTEFIDK